MQDIQWSSPPVTSSSTPVEVFSAPRAFPAVTAAVPPKAVCRWVLESSWLGLLASYHLQAATSGVFYSLCSYIHICKFIGTSPRRDSAGFCGCPEFNTSRRWLPGNFLVSPASIQLAAQPVQQQLPQVAAQQGTPASSVLPASLSLLASLQRPFSSGAPALTVHDLGLLRMDQFWPGHSGNLSIIQWAATTSQRNESQSWEESPSLDTSSASGYSLELFWSLFTSFLWKQWIILHIKLSLFKLLWGFRLLARLLLINTIIISYP